MKNKIKTISVQIIILAIIFVCGYWYGSKTVKKEYIFEEVVKTQTVMTSSIQYIKETQIEKSNQKEFEGERIITREIKVPCNCPTPNPENKCNLYTQETPPSYALQFDFSQGYQILSERIEERGKSSEQASESFQEHVSENKQDSSSVSSESQKNIQETITPTSKDWFFEASVGYNWYSQDIVFGAAAYRRIVGPIHVGLELKTSQKLQGDVSIGAGLSF